MSFATASAFGYWQNRATYLDFGGTSATCNNATFTNADMNIRPPNWPANYWLGGSLLWTEVAGYSYDWLTSPTAFDQEEPFFEAVQPSPELSEVVTWLPLPFLDEYEGMALINFGMDQEDGFPLVTTIVSGSTVVFIDEDALSVVTVLEDEVPPVQLAASSVWTLPVVAVLDEDSGAALVNFSLEHHEPYVVLTEVAPWLPAPFIYDETSTSLANFFLDFEEGQPPVIGGGVQVTSYYQAGLLLWDEEASHVILEQEDAPYVAVFDSSIQYRLVVPFLLDDEPLPVVQTVSDSVTIVVTPYATIIGLRTTDGAKAGYTVPPQFLGVKGGWQQSTQPARVWQSVERTDRSVEAAKRAKTKRKRERTLAVALMLLGDD